MYKTSIIDFFFDLDGSVPFATYRSVLYMRCCFELVKDEVQQTSITPGRFFAKELTQSASD